ncbi:MAG: FAD:protein FMN transferase [bacterium]|nr:FAD:protein FMN transferase [bacterium]
MVQWGRVLAVTLLGIVLFLFPHCTGSKTGSNSDQNDHSDLIEIRGNTMGTTYMVKVAPMGESRTANREVMTRQLSDGIDQLLKVVNLRMSTYIKDSEISRFNRYRQGGWFDVSVDTAVVFAEAIRVSGTAGGAFDITLGPLINLWGFGPSRKKGEIPSDLEIDSVMSIIGYEKLIVRLTPPSLKKEVPGLYCDLSAIAKGFGVDKVAEYLEFKGCSDYMVEIGGEIRTNGSKYNNQPWRVAIARPDSGSDYQKTLPLRNASMATSGDYHNYFEKDGVRYSHTIDPTTGSPITHNLVSVTVIHKSCMTADAMATAINVLGPEKGYDLALRENLAVLMVLRKKGNFVEKITPAFEEILGDQQ